VAAGLEPVDVLERQREAWFRAPHNEVDAPGDPHPRERP
jgi:hypothetical protein